MKSRRLLKLAALLALVVASVGASRSASVTASPCHRIESCLICHASNADCVVAFCPSGIYSDCF